MALSRRLAGWTTWGWILVLTSCAAAGQSNTQDPFGGGAPGFGDPVLVTIENNDFRDATVYGLWNGMRQRIGMVTGKTSETFSMDWKSETFSFYVNFVGGGEYRSEEIEVWAGDHLDFVIMPMW